MFYQPRATTRALSYQLPFTDGFILLLVPHHSRVSCNSISLCSVPKALMSTESRELTCGTVLGSKHSSFRVISWYYGCPTLSRRRRPLQACWIAEGLVCPVVTELLRLKPKPVFKMASGAIEPRLSFIVPSLYLRHTRPTALALWPLRILRHRAVHCILASAAFYVSLRLSGETVQSGLKTQTPNYLKTFSVYRNVLSCHHILTFMFISVHLKPKYLSERSL